MWSWEPLLLSLKLATVTVGLLLFICLPVSWYLSRRQGWIKELLQVIICLPIVLPPTVLGLYLLILFNPNHRFGKFWHYLTGQSLLFNFSSLVIGSMIYSLPFVMQPIIGVFEEVNQQYTEAGLSLGINEWHLLSRLVIPCSIMGILRGGLLGFAHTLGEFGVVLMLGGNIPGETQVASVAIYEQVEQLNFHGAQLESLYLVIGGFVIMAICQLYCVQKNK